MKKQINIKYIKYFFEALKIIEKIEPPKNTDDAFELITSVLYISHVLMEKAGLDKDEQKKLASDIFDNLMK